MYESNAWKRRCFEILALIVQNLLLLLKYDVLLSGEPTGFGEHPQAARVSHICHESHDVFVVESEQ